MGIVGRWRHPNVRGGGLSPEGGLFPLDNDQPFYKSPVLSSSQKVLASPSSQISRWNTVRSFQYKLRGVQILNPALYPFSWEVLHLLMSYATGKSDNCSSMYLRTVFRWFKTLQQCGFKESLVECGLNISTTLCIQVIKQFNLLHRHRNSSLIGGTKLNHTPQSRLRRCGFQGNYVPSAWQCRWCIKGRQFILTKFGC